MRAYFKLDLYFFEHPKVIDLSPEAVVLYIAAIAHANRRETDGFVHHKVIRRLVDIDRLSHALVAEELAKAELWEPVEDGWQIHDFLDHNDSSEERDDRREAERERKRRGRAKAKDRPDRPEPPSGGPSGSVPPDKHGRPSGQNRPSEPVRDIALTEQSTNSRVPPSAARVASATPATVTPIPTAQTFVAAYVDAYRGRAGHDPPSRVKGQLARELRQLLDDGVPTEHIRAGFVEWFDANQHPATLPSFIEVAGRGGTPRSRPTRPQQQRQQIVETDQALDRWAEGGGSGPARVEEDRGQAEQQLPRPGTSP